MCTTKLELGSRARALYDWEGNELKQLDDGWLILAICHFVSKNYRFIRTVVTMTVMSGIENSKN